VPPVADMGLEYAAFAVPAGSEAEIVNAEAVGVTGAAAIDTVSAAVVAVLPKLRLFAAELASVTLTPKE